MYDITFLSFGEPKAEVHWNLLKNRFPMAFRVDGVSPIVAAHKAAAKLCRTKYFWVVDADNIVSEDFDFSFTWSKDDNITDRVAVWRAKNNINGLTYGYGGIKLLPRKSVLKVSDSVIDFTTSISDHFHIMDEVASITEIDFTPFEAWRSGFREAAKLTSRIIARQDDSETYERLRVWRTVGSGDNGSYAIQGAIAGSNFAKCNGDLKLINDWDWLKGRYDEKY